MAAHPFGPIENQLIVGYYKRGFDPTRVKPRYRERRFLIPNSQHNPIHHILQPVFYGWSPANGNSSSHDFQINMGLEQLSRHELLSRGLGYRITFTMPSKQIDQLDTQTWPETELELLDYFGKNTLFRKSGRLCPSGPEVVRAYFASFETLLVEATPLHWRFVENGTTEYVFPTFAKLSSEELSAANRFRSVHFLLIDFLQDQSTNQDFIYSKDLLNNMMGILSLLAEPPDSITPEQAAIFRRRIIWVGPQVLMVIKRAMTTETITGIPTDVVTASNFGQKLDQLLRQQPFSDQRPMDLSLVASLWRHLQIARMQLLSRDYEAYLTAYLKDFEDLELRSTVHFPMDQFFFYFTTLIKSAHDAEPLWKNKHFYRTAKSTSFNLVIKFFKNLEFEILVYRRGDPHNLNLTLPVKASFLSVLPDTDLLLCLHDDQFKEGKLQLIDLQETYSNRLRGIIEVAYVPLPEFRPSTLTQYMRSLHVCKTGITVLSVNEGSKSVLDMRVRHLPYNKTQLGGESNQEKWTKYLFKELKSSSFPQNLTSADDYSLHQSEKSREIFIALWCKPRGPGVSAKNHLLICLRYEPKHSTLTPSAVTMISESQLKGTTYVWIETKKGRTSNTYACVFTSDRLRSIWMHKKEAFLPLVVHETFTTPPVGAPVRFMHYVDCRGVGVHVSVLRCRFVQTLPDGHDCYRVGRLYLKY